jgi:dTMP kinase
VFEGAEGVGKTTQVTRLVARIAGSGVACEHYREPGGTPLGDAVRALLLDPAGDVAPRAERCCSWRRARSSARTWAPGYTRGVGGARPGSSCPPTPTRSPAAASRRRGAGGNPLATAGSSPTLTVLLALDPAGGARAHGRRAGGSTGWSREDAAFHARVGEAFLSAPTRRGSGSTRGRPRSCGSTPDGRRAEVEARVGRARRPLA